MTRGAANAMTPASSRTGWDELPAEVRDEITSKTGTVHHVETIAAGLNSAIAARLDTADGQIFLKGTISERAAAARREARINPLVTGVSPQLRWQLETGGWHILGFDFIHGRRADYSPGSTDLHSLTTTLTSRSTITAPPDSRHITDRWSAAAHRAGADPELFAGDRLLHTDLNPHNVLITNGGAHLVDWSWPSQGAAWIDTACAALWLIAEGNTPDDAETWAHGCLAREQVNTTALDAFADAQARSGKRSHTPIPSLGSNVLKPLHTHGAIIAMVSDRQQSRLYAVKFETAAVNASQGLCSNANLGPFGF